jgi:hypothetical protein
MTSIYNPIPNSPFYSAPTYSVDSGSGPLIVGAGLTVTPDGTLLVTSALGGTVSQVTAGTGLSGGTITTTGTIDLVPATASSLGGIKVGANLLIAPDGTLSALSPGTGTVNSINVGAGLTGGGSGSSVTINLAAASTTQFGGVIVGPGINVTGGLISLSQATTGAAGGVQLATPAEVIAGTSATKAVTPVGLAAKVATTLVPGIVQLSDNASLTSSVLAATPTAVKTAFTAAQAAQATANAALPKAGGTMTGTLTFAPGQTFPGVAFPVATPLSVGVISVGSGLSVNVSGVLSTINNGTVTSIVAGPGIGAPATNDIITSTGTLRLLPPTTDGLTLGGVKEGNNINISNDGTINVEGALLTNNPYAYNSYIFPVAATPYAAPGVNGSFLRLKDRVTGEVEWATNNGVTSITAGSGLTGGTITSTGTIGLATTTVVSGTYGATGLISTFTVDSFGRVISAGEANPYSPFQTATVSAPPNLVLDFADNNLNWEWTLLGNTAMKAPQNAESGQKGTIIIRQNSISPYVLTWDAEWKWGNFTPVMVTPVASAVDLFEFTVYSPTNIIITNVVQNIG